VLLLKRLAPARTDMSAADAAIAKQIALEPYRAAAAGCNIAKPRTLALHAPLPVLSTGRGCAPPNRRTTA